MSAEEGEQVSPPWQEGSANDRVPSQKLEKNPTSREEEDNLFRTPEERDQRRLLNARLKLENRQFKRDIKNREAFAAKAYGFTQSWIGFLFVLTSAQFGLKSFNVGLTQTEFVTVVTTTTVSILGFWLLVGKYLFKISEGDKKAKKLPEPKK